MKLTREWVDAARAHAKARERETKAEAEAREERNDADGGDGWHWWRPLARAWAVTLRGAVPEPAVNPDRTPEEPAPGSSATKGPARGSSPAGEDRCWWRAATSGPDRGRRVG